MDFIINNIFYWNKLNISDKKKILSRPILNNINIKSNVKKILYDVYKNGDQALYYYTKKFDNTIINNLFIKKKKILDSFLKVNVNIKKSILTAAKNIELFHSYQKTKIIDIHTQDGIRCQQITKPINSVGLYIPGGSAPLLSTVLMLSIPAILAQCNKIILCSPPPISNEILYTAYYVCGIKNILQIGGPQAIGAMAFGTDSICKVDKIFGPGNAYVTEAKKQVNHSFNYTDIDMLAGPSEVLVIADIHSNPDFVAADLLSQAEHGMDSQVILLTDNLILANSVITSLKKQICMLSRINIIKNSLKHSKIIITKNIQECIDISNYYAPEHLILQFKNARHWLNKIYNAGSIFIGPWSPESVGDYASGTNHVLPTYGKVKTFSGVGLADFQKKISVQELTKKALFDIYPTVKNLSQFEQLDAHHNAISIRLKYLNK